MKVAVIVLVVLGWLCLIIAAGVSLLESIQLIGIGLGFLVSALLITQAQVVASLSPRGPVPSRDRIMND